MVGTMVSATLQEKDEDIGARRHSTSHDDGASEQFAHIAHTPWEVDVEQQTLHITDQLHKVPCCKSEAPSAKGKAMLPHTGGLGDEEAEARSETSITSRNTDIKSRVS